ncbi:MAG: bifunctional pyr operon transcriptional regulator/uracil phosphoribosyltransferase PyrR [Acidiferrobacterales bacterium]
MSVPRQTLSGDVDIDQSLGRIAEQLRPLLPRDPTLIGIHTGGVWIARRLQDLLQLREPIGTLDISFYRDDFTRIGMNPEVKASDLPTNIDDRHVILIDDVLHTGRTIRAALNEIFDYGRPASVTLAVLVDRNDRELPIQANVVGETINLKQNQHVKLTCDSPTGDGKLELKIQEVNG